MKCVLCRAAGNSNINKPNKSKTSCAGGCHNMPLQVGLWPFDLESGIRVDFVCDDCDLPSLSLTIKGSWTPWRFGLVCCRQPLTRVPLPNWKWPPGSHTCFRADADHNPQNIGLAWTRLCSSYRACCKNTAVYWFRGQN